MFHLFASSQKGDVVLMLFAFACIGTGLIGLLVWSLWRRLIDGKWPDSPFHNHPR